MAEDVFELGGTVIEGKYRVDAVVGEGGFGVVYRGRHLSFESDIAVKCLKVPAHFTKEARELFFENFRKEGKLLDALSREHVFIVRVYDFGVTQAAGGNDVPFLVLEWFEGRDLEQELSQRKRPFSELEAIELLRPAVEAIAKAHVMVPPVAHRDVKPANLFVAGASLKVLDFGIAKAMQEGETATQRMTKTASGFSAFSPQYGAPEQFFSKKYGPTGPWTDVHALGLILTEMVTGEPAYEGDEYPEWYEAATSRERPTPCARGAKVSDAFEEMCAKAIALMPSDRYPDAGQMLAAINAIVRASRPPAAKVKGVPKAEVGAATQLAMETFVLGSKSSRGATGEPVGQTDLTSEREATEVRGDRRQRSVVTTVAAAILVAVAIAAVVMWSGDDEQKEAAAPDAENEPRVGAAASASSLAAESKDEMRRPAASTAAAAAASAAASAVAFAVAERRAEEQRAARDRMTGEMNQIPAGEFQMGAHRNDDEKPVHEVSVEAFEMDRTEVTVGGYRACVEAGKCEASSMVEWKDLSDRERKMHSRFCNWGKTARDGHPMNCVDWNQAGAFCAWAGKRLPTEEEWEYAARGTDGRRYPWGDTKPSSQLCWNRSDGTCSVGRHPAGDSPFALSDMAGNVSEWTSSGYSKNYRRHRTSSRRVDRGGSWYSHAPSAVRTAERAGNAPSLRSATRGFRCAR